MQCRLTYSSRNAGRLVVNEAASLPDHFAIYNSFRSRKGRACRVVWRSNDEVGFEFLTEERFPNRSRAKDRAKR